MSDRGYLIKEIGQKAGIAAEDGTVTVEFTVTDIEVDFECTSEYSEPPENGHFVALTFDVKTLPALGEDPYVNTFGISEYDLAVFSPDGLRENDSSGNAFMCLDEGDQLPQNMGPGQRATGKVVVDTANKSGIVAFSTMMFMDSGGWEWNY